MARLPPTRGRGPRGGRGRAAGPVRATAIGDPASAGVVAGAAGHGAGTVAAGVAAGDAAGVAAFGGAAGGGREGGRGCGGARGGGGEKGIRKPGRAKIVIKPILNDHQRQTTFTKRKNGLMKKVEELAVLCGVEMCLVCYGASRGTDKQNNNQNNSLLWGKPSEEDVIRRYKAIPKDEQDKRKMDNTSMLESLIKKHASELRQLRETNHKLIQDKGCYQRGYEVLRHCTVAQLRNLMDEVKQKRDMVHAKLEHIQREEQARLQIQQASRARASGGAYPGQMPCAFEAGRGQYLQPALDTSRGCADGEGVVPVLESTGVDSTLASGMHQNYPRMPQGLNLSKLLHMEQQQFLPFSASSSGMQRLAPQSYRWENQAVPPPNLMLYHQIQHQNLLFTLRLNQQQQQQLRANQQEELQYQQSLKRTLQEQLQEQPSLKRGRQEQLQYQPSLKRGSQEELQYQQSLTRGSQEQPSLKRQQQMQHFEQESSQLQQPDPQPNVDNPAEPEPADDDWASFDDPNSEFEWLNRDQPPLTSF